MRNSIKTKAFVKVGKDEFEIPVYARFKLHQDSMQSKYGNFVGSVDGKGYFQVSLKHRLDFGLNRKIRIDFGKYRFPAIITGSCAYERILRCDFISYGSPLDISSP